MSSVLLPALNTGVTFAIFKSSGNLLFKRQAKQILQKFTNLAKVPPHYIKVNFMPRALICQY